MKSTLFFKLLLLLQVVAVLVYTVIAFNHEGANLFGVFFNSILSAGWSGQFNLDFLCYLLLSGLWIMWRERFTTRSVITGLIAMILGILFFVPYLLWLLQKEKGDLKRVFTGEQ